MPESTQDLAGLLTPLLEGLTTHIRQLVVERDEFKDRAEMSEEANVTLLRNTDKEIVRLTGERDAANATACHIADVGLDETTKEVLASRTAEVERLTEERDEYRRAYCAVMGAVGLSEHCEIHEVKERMDRLTAEANVGTKDGPCYYCGEPTESRSARPTLWPVRLCHADEPGVSKPHHRVCIDVRLVEHATSAAVIEVLRNKLSAILNLAEDGIMFSTERPRKSTQGITVFGQRTLQMGRRTESETKPPHFVAGMQHVEKPEPTPMPSPGVCAADAAKAR
jgi:hypothetical protein